MLIRSPRIVLIVVGIAVTVLAAWSLRYFSGVEPLTVLAKNYAQTGLGQIGLQASDAVVVGHESGHRHWRMTANTVTFSRDRRSLMVDGIRDGILYDSATHPLVSINAAHAVWQTPLGALSAANAGTLRLDGGVLARVLTREHPILQSQAVVWDSQHSLVVSPGPLSAAVPRLTVTAGSGTFTLPNSRPSQQNSGGTLVLSRGTRGVFRSRNGLATLSCPGLVWNSDLNLARTQGAVTATIPGGLGTATAVDASANTRTGDLSGHGFSGTLLLSTEVH